MRPRRILTPPLAAAALVGVLAAPAAAQPARERGFVAVSGGLMHPQGAVADRFEYELHTETATTRATYPRRAGVLIDAGAGWRLWTNGGVAVAFARSSADMAASVEAELPHPLLDNQHRHVAGEAGGLRGSETAAHVGVYFLRQTGRWRLRLMAGASHFRVERDIVTAVEVTESYPYDTAAFRTATTRRARGSAPGANGGLDVAWMATRRVGVGALLRYARASVDLDTGGRSVSLDAGGFQAAGGLRIAF